MTARIICLIIFILEVKGLSISLPRRKWEALAFYTQLSNIVTVISALLLVILGKNLIITSIVCLVFAIFTEAIKIGIVGRYFSWTDVGLNLIGAVADDSSGMPGAIELHDGNGRGDVRTDDGSGGVQGIF